MILYLMDNKDTGELLKEYINEATGVHQKRMQSLQEANRVLEGEYRMVSSEMALLQEDRSALNHDIDALINTFSVVDQIEQDVRQTEENVDLIFKAINRLNKKVIEYGKRKKGG